MGRLPFPICACAVGATLLLITRPALPAETPKRANGLSLTAASMESENNLATGSSVTSSDNSTFACRRVLLFHDGSYPLLQRVSSILKQRLVDSPLVEQVDLAENAAVPSKTKSVKTALPDGARAPDLFLRLELESVKEAGWIARSLDAVITGSVGDAPWHSHHSVVDDTTPPVIGFRWNGRLDHKSTVRGVETPKYRSAAENIANEFAKAITNELVKLSKEYGTLPVLPDNFFGPYHPAPALPFLRDLKAELKASYYGLLTHNQTFWRFQTGSNPVPKLEQIARQLTTGGWRVEPYSFTNTEAFYLAAARDNNRIEIFNPGEAGIGSGPEVSAPLEFVCHYRQPFSRPEREAALEKLLAANPPVETLLLFERLYSEPQRHRFYSLLEKAPASTSQAWLSRARIYLQRKDTNSAISSLVQAKALLATLNDTSKMESRLQGVAQEISPKQPLALPITADTYRKLGFHEITYAPRLFAVEKKVGEPLLMFISGRAQEPEALCLTLQPSVSKDGNNSYEWSWIQTEAPGRSVMSSSMALRDKADWTQTFHVDGYAIKIRVSSADPGKSLNFLVDIQPAETELQ